jgi:CRP/FNR family transcriptional regulator, cyclic AMP receptor protein
MHTLGATLGFIGAVLMVASYLMKSMLPLRYVALAANVFLVAYAVINHSWPTMVLYLAMIPINLRKVRDIRRLMAAMASARADTPLSEWLLPHMTRREAKAGQVLWRQGDEATEMVYVHSGSLQISEHGSTLGPGDLVGEIGVFSPDHRRTASVVCQSDCTLYSLSSDGVAQLYFQNPKLGFHVMRLVVERLRRDAERAQAEAALARAQAA